MIVLSVIEAFFLQVLAFDKDEGKNAEIQYSIRAGKGKTKFRIHNTTGMVYAHKGFEPGQEYELYVCKTHICRTRAAIYIIKYD